MHDWQSLSHVRWDCKYHVVIIPKYRKRKLYGKFKRHVGDILKDLHRQRSVELLEGNLRADHIHMCLSVPPKFSIAFVNGFLKGKSAVRIHRYLLKSKQTKGKHAKLTHLRSELVVAVPMNASPAERETSGSHLEGGEDNYRVHLNPKSLAQNRINKY
jgi:putative transposase